MIELSRRDDVFIITMNDGPNVIDIEWTDSFIARLDEVIAGSTGAAALVLTGVDKFFCNGLNLEVVSKFSSEQFATFGAQQGRMQSKLLSMPIPVIAAVNGHAFAAGAILALACDYRLMREDRGWICMSEVDVGVPIGNASMDLLASKLTPATLRDMVLTGKRYTGGEALTAGIVDAVAAEECLLDDAVAMAAGLSSKERGIFSNIKNSLYGRVAESIG